MTANGNLAVTLDGLVTQDFGAGFAPGSSEFLTTTSLTGSTFATGKLQRGLLAPVVGALSGAVFASKSVTSAEILTRLLSLLPGGWFGWAAPLRDAVLGGLADALAANGVLLQAVRDQTRVVTSSGWMLDLTAWDFFGIRFRRFSGEIDASFRSRVLREVTRERVTRTGVAAALLDLTGKAPTIFEPFSAKDCGGGYGSLRLGYSRSGRYGSVSFPNQVFITARRPTIAAIPKVPGYGSVQGGYGRPPSAYASLTEVQGAVQDSDIVTCVKNNVAAGVVGWLEIRS